MVYITQWEEFAVSSERLCLSSPEKTRFSFKYRPSDGVFVVKVTDDRTLYGSIFRKLVVPAIQEYTKERLTQDGDVEHAASWFDDVLRYKCRCRDLCSRQ